MTNRPKRRALTALVALIALSSACSAGYDRPFSDHEQLGSGSFAVKTVCPTSATLTTGIDVSKWQSTIDWAAVKGGGKVKFAITRASHGVNTIDGRFDFNFKSILAQGLVRGVYQYFEPGQDAIAQADLMLQMINDAGGLKPGDLPPVLDLETTSGKSPAVVQAQALKWLQHVEAKIGRKPMVYTAAYFSQSNIGAALKDYPLWIANYKYTTTGACPLMPDASWGKWTVWQYSDKGSVPGISGGVDMNVFDGTLAELKAFAGSGPTTPPGDRADLQLAITIESIGGQARDSCQSGGSLNIFDLHQGQTTDVYFDVRNSGKQAAEGVRVVLDLDEPYLVARRWGIQGDGSGSFQVDAADGTQSIAHDTPGPRFALTLGRVAPGETKRVALTLTAEQPSLGKLEHAEVRAWVEHIDASGSTAAYAKADYGSAPSSAAGQRFNGGDLELRAQADILGVELCGDGIDNDCNGDVDDCQGGGQSDGGVVTDAGIGGDTSGASQPPPRGRPQDGCAIHAGSARPPLAAVTLTLLLLALMRRRRRRTMGAQSS
jgi:GH25 family lysozyme M1 (1,4-beta-N-acetylmuramidase)